MQLTKKSKEILSSMIKTEFNKKKLKNEYIYKKADELIEVAKELNLNDLAEELKSDLKVELQ